MVGSSANLPTTGNSFLPIIGIAESLKEVRTTSAYNVLLKGNANVNRMVTRCKPVGDWLLYG